VSISFLTKMRDLIQREARVPFFRQIDLYRIENGVLIGVSGVLGTGFVIDPRDLLLQGDDAILDFENRTRKFLNALPEGATFHFIVRAGEEGEASLRSYRAFLAGEDMLSQALADSKVRFWRQHPFFKKELFLFVTIPPGKKKTRASWLPDLSLAFGKKAHLASEIEFQKTKEALTAVSEVVTEGLRTLGFNVRPLHDSETLGYLYELLNPSLAEQGVSSERFMKDVSYCEERASLRSRLLLNLPVSDYGDFYLNGYFHQGINLSALPEETTLKSMRDFEKELGREYLLTLTLEVPDQEKEKAWIKREGNYARAKNFFSRSRDHEAVAKAGEADEFLTEIAATWDKILYASLAVLVKGKTREAVRERSGNVLRAFRRLGGAEGLVDHMNHDRLFLTFLPLQGEENPLAFPVPSAAAAHLLPVQGSWKGTEGQGVLLKTWRDEPLRLDLFDPKLQAKHAVMLGSTGAGKSFFTSYLLLHFLMASKSHEVIVIDLGGSYRKLSQALKGAYFEVECSEHYALNPFPSKSALFPKDGEADSTFLQFLKELLQRMIAPSGPWAASEKMILERVLREVYRPLEEDETPLLGDIEKGLRGFSEGDEEDKRKAYQFAKELSLFTQGEYGKVLNRKGTFDFNARFTVFDLRKISRYPELQEILLFIIPFALKRKFENLAIKKILVLDECWQLLKESQGTELVEVFYRTARKLNAGVLSISQNPEDFLESKISGVMVNNSPIKYILRLKKGHEKLVSFGLNENEIVAARELEVRPGQYSEVFIKFDDHGVIAKVEPNPLEYWIATTDPADLAQESNLRAAEPLKTNLELFETLARKFPGGASKPREAANA
jgi:conjugal transfer ATP-binding protein TraC